MDYLNKKTKSVEKSLNTIENTEVIDNSFSTLEYDESIGDWIIDTDPGVDDAFALTLAINILKDKLKLISIQCGNVGLDQCLINAKKLCVINGRKYDISTGGSYTISTKSLRTYSSIHGKDGFFDIEKYQDYDKLYDTKTDYLNNNEASKFGLLKSHSAIEIIKLSQNYKKNKTKLNIMTIGPLTNLAVAYMLDPSLISRVNKLVVMGGSYQSFGNIKSTGEFNFACDDVAAKKVLDKFKNVDVYCWEPSMSHLIFPEHIKFTDEAKKTEKAMFIQHCVDKKMSGLQKGVYADYGAAVVGFYPLSIKSSFEGYCDLTIDSEENKQSRFVVSDVNYTNNKGKQRHRIIEKVDLSFFHGLFNKMINC